MLKNISGLAAGIMRFALLFLIVLLPREGMSKPATMQCLFNGSSWIADQFFEPDNGKTVETAEADGRTLRKFRLDE